MVIHVLGKLRQRSNEEVKKKVLSVEKEEIQEHAKKHDELMKLKYFNINNKITTVRTGKITKATEEQNGN